jgi:hypothetical protein
MEIFLGWLIFAVVVAIGAAARGRSGVGWFFLSVLISPLLSVLLLLLLPKLNAPTASVVVSGGAVPTPETHVRCPDCRELVFKDAKKCRFCGCPLIPQP